MKLSLIRKHLPLILFSCLVALAYSPQTEAQNPNRVALVVDYGNGSVQTSCIDFSEESLTGYELLERSNLPLTIGVDTVGTTVCAIDGVGCPANDCFCQCSGGSDCVFWSYWHGTADSWQFSTLGASNYVVHDGDVEGWRWGNGSIQTADPPPHYSFGDVCTVPATPTPIVVTLPPTAVPAAATTGATAVPTATATTGSTATSIPTASPNPTLTRRATQTPTPTPTENTTSSVDIAGPTSSPTVDLSSPATLRPTVTAWAATAEPSLLPTETAVPAAVTPTTEVVIVALPTLTPESGLSVTAVSRPAFESATDGPVAIAAVGNDTDIGDAASADAPVTANRIGADTAPVSQIPQNIATTSTPVATYSVFGLVLFALGFVWWQGRRQRAA